ncbi:MAG: site-2 protease family protein [Tissierellales bacterium]|jgi:Zn-dependent protease|nr:site-2 protease family protein [Tissierellales bacterium]
MPNMQEMLNLLMGLPALLLALTFHELGHGLASYLLGDPTAKNQGRLTLDPIAHIDPIGFFALLFFKFGWAKPVPIDPRYYKNRKLGIALTSIAGPMSNFILAVITGLIFRFAYNAQIEFFFSNDIMFNFMSSLLIYNISLGLFNLIPIPPLDGSKILASMLPDKLEYKFYQYERYSMVILVLFMYLGVFRTIFSPIVNGAINLFISNIIF